MFVATADCPFNISVQTASFLPTLLPRLTKAQCLLKTQVLFLKSDKTSSNHRLH